MPAAAWWSLPDYTNLLADTNATVQYVEISTSQPAWFRARAWLRALENP
jgi:hypothetical protein